MCRILNWVWILLSDKHLKIVSLREVEPWTFRLPRRNRTSKLYSQFTLWNYNYIYSNCKRYYISKWWIYIFMFQQLLANVFNNDTRHTCKLVFPFLEHINKCLFSIKFCSFKRRDITLWTLWVIKLHKTISSNINCFSYKCRYGHSTPYMWC